MGLFDDIIYSDDALASGRSMFQDELSDPSVYDDLTNRVSNEVGGQTERERLAFIESVMNRAQSRGMPLSAAVNDPNYFPQASFRRGIPSGDYRRLVDEAMAGSNVARWGTGNESGNVHSGGALVTMRGDQGERFVVENPDAAFPFKDIVGGGHFDDIVNAPSPELADRPSPIEDPRERQFSPLDEEIYRTRQAAAPTGLQGVLDMKSGKTAAQREELNRPLHEAMSVPAVSPALMEEIIKRGQVDTGMGNEESPTAQGIREELAKAGSSMTTGEGIASLPLYAFPPTGVALSAENTAELPGQVAETAEAMRRGDTKGAAAAGTRAGLNALMTAAIVKGGAEVMKPEGAAERLARIDRETPPAVDMNLARETEAVRPENVESMMLRDRLQREMRRDDEKARRRDVAAAQPHVDPDTGQVVYRPEQTAPEIATEYRPQGVPVKQGAVGEPGPRSIEATVRGAERPVEASGERPATATPTEPVEAGAGPKAEAPGGIMDIDPAKMDEAKANGWDKYDEQYFWRPDRAEPGYPETNVGLNVGDKTVHTPEKVARAFERVGAKVRDVQPKPVKAGEEPTAWLQFEKGQEPTPRQRQRVRQKLQQTAIPYRFAERAPVAEAHPAAGIAQAKAGEFHGTEPGKVEMPEVMIDKAVERAKQGLSDPGQIATRVQRGIAVGAEEMADLAVEHGRLMDAANEIDPEITGNKSPGAERAFQEKLSDARNFYQTSVKPAMTQWGATGRAMQNAAAFRMADPLTRAGFKHIAETRMNRELMPKEVALGERMRQKNLKAAKDVQAKADKSAAVADKVTAKRPEPTKESIKARFEKLVEKLTPCEI